MSNFIRIALCILHGALFFFTILAAVHLIPIVNPPNMDPGEMGVAGLFGLLTAIGVIVSWVISAVLYFECEFDSDDYWLVIGSSLHSAIVAGLLYAWITYIPLLFN